MSFGGAYDNLKILHQSRPEIAKHHIRSRRSGLTVFLIMKLKDLTPYLSIAAILLSLLSLYISYYNPTKDASSIVVGGLGGLATIIIGWQIYSLINLREYENEIKKLEAQINESKKDLNQSMLNTYHLMYRTKGNDEGRLARLYHELWDPSFKTDEYYLYKELFYWLLNIHDCLSCDNLTELRIAKNNFLASMNSGIELSDISKDALRKQWADTANQFSKTTGLESRELMYDLNELSHAIDKL